MMVIIVVACTKKQEGIESNTKKEGINSGIISVKLKFRDDNNRLEDEERLINEDEVLVSNILDQLIKGPERTSKLKPVLPVDTRVSAVSIKDRIAYVTFDFTNFNHSFTEEEEEKAVESIVLTLTELKFVDKVKINVNPISDKFNSFIDISKPLSDDNYILESS